MRKQIEIERKSYANLCVAGEKKLKLMAVEVEVVEEAAFAR